MTSPSATTIKGHIELSGAKNFRDFGGHINRHGQRVKSGLLFRSDSLSYLSDADLERISPLGIKTVCDLRRPGETTRSPSRWPQATPSQFYHLPFFNDPANIRDSHNTGNLLATARQRNSAAASRQLMQAVYQNMVTEPQALQQLSKIFRLLATGDDLPLLIHCSGGKDRTGVTCALILTLLQVSWDDVLADYMASLELYSQRLGSQRSQYDNQAIDNQTQATLGEEALLPIYQVAAEYLDSAFAAIKSHYIDITDFFHIGLSLSNEDITAIKYNLLENNG